MNQFCTQPQGSAEVSTVFAGRTFPSHPYFASQLGHGQLCLFNILKAYSVLDEEVGYCQGLSFVAGILLMHMKEKEAFDTLRFILYDLNVRRQYKPDMRELQVNSYLRLCSPLRIIKKCRFNRILRAFSLSLPMT